MDDLYGLQRLFSKDNEVNNKHSLKMNAEKTKFLVINKMLAAKEKQLDPK